MSKQSYKQPNSRPYVPLKPSKHQKSPSKNQKKPSKNQKKPSKYQKKPKEDSFEQMIDNLFTNLSDEMSSMLIGERLTGGLSTNAATNLDKVNVPRMFREDISVLETRYRDMDAMTLGGTPLRPTTYGMPLTTSSLLNSWIGSPSFSRSSYIQTPYSWLGTSRISSFYDVVRNGTVDDIIHLTKTEDDRKLIMRVVCSVGRADMFDYLVSIGIKPDDTCLSNSFENSLFDRILAMGTPSDEAFHWACNKGDLTNFNKLLYASDINHEMQFFGTPLKSAVKNDHTDIALTLLSLGAEPQDNLKYAVENDNEVLVAALIQHGAEVTDYCKRVATPKVKQLLEQH